MLRGGWLSRSGSRANYLNLDERITVRRSDVRTGTGVLQYHDPGMTLTVRDLITEMIITSDNTATNIVMAKVGGRDRINEIFVQRGYVTRTTWGTIDGTRKMFALLGGPFTKLTDEEIIGLDLFRSGSPSVPIVTRTSSSARTKN